MGAIKGNKIVYLYRLLADAKTMAAMALAFQTENGRTKSRDSDTVVTKDGPIRVRAILNRNLCNRTVCR